MADPTLTKEAQAMFIRSGAISREALLYGKGLIKPGILIRDVLDKVEEKIRSLGGEPAFPAQSSINDCAAHHCPDDQDETIYNEGDLVKLDVGAHVEGYVTDNALTVDLGSAYKDLIKASRDALKEALRLAVPGSYPSQLGRAIEEAITSHGFKPVRNLSGHGFGYYSVHKAPNIPNYEAKRSEEPLREGETIAIEPFATNGAGMVGHRGAATVHMLTSSIRVRNPISRKILDQIHQYKGLPFTNRWLTRSFGVAKVRLALADLTRQQMLSSFPPLYDEGKGMVAQSEHSLIVQDRPIILTKDP